MRKICLINNYNYEKFLPQCLNSTISQTVSFDKIIIVDDGSTDGSPKIIIDFCKQYNNAISIFKKNAGQLSCFNAAAQYILNSDLIFFLDSDDLYPSDYVENILLKSNTKDNFIFSCAVNFANVVETPIASSKINSENNIQISATREITKLTHHWLGSPTSALVISGRLFHKIFPYPHESDWRTRADDLIVYGASLTGFEKKHIPSLGIAYRVHGSNHFFGKLQTEEAIKIRANNIERFFSFILKNQSKSFACVNYLLAAKELFLLDSKVREIFFPYSYTYILRYLFIRCYYYFYYKISNLY